MDLDNLTTSVIAAAEEVHNVLGPGLTESTYQTCLARELTFRQIPFEKDKHLPMSYRGHELDGGYRLDFLVAGTLVLGVKAVDDLLPFHETELRTWLRLGGWRTGLLLNFNVVTLKEGIRQLVDTYQTMSAEAQGL